MDFKYLMENDEECLRLELKTDGGIIQRQARWAGLKPGMRVADIGCGPGKTTFFLQQLAGDQVVSVGVDASEERIDYARKHFNGAQFEVRNVLEPLDGLGTFDFIWVRFLLEYYKTKSLDIVRNISNLLNPGGILCLVDLDYNCLSHYGLSQKLERTIQSIMECLERETDFDPYMGRKLYSFFYDLGYKDIAADVSSHHLITGKLNEIDAFNWQKKIKIASGKIGYKFEEYEGGYEEFNNEFKAFFNDPRRFTYTPIILCRGIKAGA